MQTNIFITGATGCIGHYVLEALKVKFPDANYHLLVRSPKRFKQNFTEWKNVIIHQGDMDDIGKFKKELNATDYLIHIATVWGYNLDHNLRVNKTRTLEMLSYLDSKRIKKIIYFSTASILTQKNQLSDAAKTEGTPYVKSKYHGYIALKNSDLSQKVITLFPTVVLGGSDHHPYSHISQGLLDIKKTIRWARWFKVPGSFHFLHGADIAKMVTICMENQNVPADIVMGNHEISFNDAFFEMANVVNQAPWFRINLPGWFFRVLTMLFKRRIDSWGRHCLNNPQFNYETHNPSDFNESIGYPSLASVLNDMKLNDI
ncbi:MAG: NAD(P)-dependent oxidoreductase [Candidatus Margulisiibacteriota bacterium]